MFFQETTPDSTGYMIAGYAVAFIVMALYVASLYIRARNLKQDATLLEELDRPAKKPAEKQPARPERPRTGKTVTKKSGQN